MLGHAVKLSVGLVIIFVVLFGIAQAIGPHIFGSESLRRFAEHGEPVYGLVTGKVSGDLQRVQYSYRVGDVLYTGVGLAGSGNPPFEQLEVGQTVVVFYDPTSPAQSMLGYPQYDLESTELFVWAASVAFPIFPMLMFVVSYIIIISVRRRRGK